MAIISYKSAMLADNTKSGKLKADADGYYTVVVGGLNVHNSSGAYYTLKGAEQLFNDSSILMRRVRNKGLYSENGHPVQKQGMTDKQYFSRLLTIREGNICNHIAELWLDDSLHKAKPRLLERGAVAIMAKIKPYGAQKDVVADAISNPHQNLCYSVRGFTKDSIVAGTTHRMLKAIVTFDHVYLGGISIANKFNSPSLETLNEAEFLECDVAGCAVDMAKEHVATESIDLAQSILDQYSITEASSPIYSSNIWTP